MYIFAIDTDQYAGNFEREMTAYCTGRVGDCGVGGNFANMYDEDEVDEEFENVTQISDEGCYRPCSIYPTPGYFNDGMGNEYKDDENIDMLEVLEKYKKTWIDYKECSRPDHIRWDIESGKNDNHYVNELNEEIEAIKNYTLENVHKCPSYQSVAIYFSTKPTKKQIQILRDRSAYFCQNRLRCHTNQPTINIIGYRLIHEKTKKTSISLEI